jgi:DNA-binding transcriptional LysR family regulator
MAQDDDNLIQRLPRSVSLRELRVFLAVLEQRSFRRAATVLHLTQPAVTKSLSSLEDLLGHKLFDRTGSGVEPTVYGLGLAPRAVAVFDELRRAAHELSLVSRGSRGTLRVGTLAMPAVPFLPVAIQRLTEANPEIFVAVVEERQQDLIDRLRRGDIELAILRLAMLSPDESMRVDKLFDEKMCVIAAAEHALAKRRHLTWPQLMQERWVMPATDSYFYERVTRLLARYNLPMPRQVVEATSINIQFGMVLHAGMLSFGMRSQVEFAPGKQFIVRLPYELPAPATSVAAVSLRAREPSPLARQFIAHVRSLATSDDAAADPPR